jgi:type IV pilus assembly protein PilF
MSRRLPMMQAGLALLLALLAACATPPRGEAELRTDSDQTNAEKRARVRLELASAYLGRGQASTALDEVKQALAAKPDMAEGYNLRGLIYASMNEHELADQNFKRALELNPRDGDTLHNYGWYLCTQRQFERAEKQFAAALEAPQYADVPRTYMARGVCEARNNQWAEAEKSLARAFELDPANPAIAFSFSEVLYQRGQYERARFYVRRINSQANQSNAQSLWLAARIERRLGNMSGVEDFARQLRERYPNSPQALLLQRGTFDE